MSNGMLPGGSVVSDDRGFGGCDCHRDGYEIKCHRNDGDGDGDGSCDRCAHRIDHGRSRSTMTAVPQ